MTEYRIPLDPRNPGQFLACCGLFEIADLLDPGAVAGFDDRGRTFSLSTNATLPVQLHLARPDEFAQVPKALEEIGLRYPGCKTPFLLNWWLKYKLKDGQLDKTVFKTWGGQQTPRAMLDELLKQTDPNVPIESILQQSRYTTTRFGVDARTAWEPIDVGYSPNDIGQNSVTFPWVEVLAVVGLQGFRPSRNGRAYQYSTWLQPLGLPGARAAAVAPPWDGLSVIRFEFSMAGRGQGYKTFLLAKELEK